MHNGDLMWFRHDGREDESFRWAANEGKKVGSGWSFRKVFAAKGDVFYAITDDGYFMW
jgi:Tachylectin